MLLHDSEIYISYITEIELLGFHAITEAEEERIEEMISLCTVIEMNNEIKKETIRIRRNYKTKVNDSVIAATSRYLNMPLLTADSGFLKIKDLDLRLYEK